MRRRLTRTGQVFVVCAFLALLASWNSGVNLYYLVFAAIASFILFSFLLSRRNLLKLELEIEAPHAVHRHQSFTTLIRIRNLRRLLPVSSIRIEMENAPGVSQGFVLGIPARRVAQVRVTQLFERRGVHRLAQFHLVSSFPFGLVEARRQMDGNAEVLVYPRVLTARTAIIDQLRGAGEIPKVAQGPGDEFFSLREYVPGDDLRFISWRATARAGHLMVKELEQQTTRYVVFVFDSRTRPDIDGFYDHFESAIETIASLAVTLLNRQYRVSLVSSSLQLSEGDGTAQMLKLLELLARIEPADNETNDPFWRALELDDRRRVSFLVVSPDPAKWGEVQPGGQIRVLDPREVVHA